VVSEDKQIWSYNEFQNEYMISTNYLEYYGIVGAVPLRWINIKMHMHFNSLVQLKEL
jgi:hypothetical protein